MSNRAARVDIKMTTGDKVHTTRAKVVECVILNLDENLNKETVYNEKLSELLT